MFTHQKPYNSINNEDVRHSNPPFPIIVDWIIKYKNKKYNIQKKFNSIKIQNLFVVGLIELDYSFIVIKKKNSLEIHLCLSHLLFEIHLNTQLFLLTSFSVRLETVYLVETKNFFVECIVNKCKN